MRRAARSEEGFAMVMVLGMTVLLIVLAFGLIDVMQSEASRSRTAVKRDAAYQAAEAGVDDYIAKLIDDHLYYVHFVHPGEATRRATASGRIVAATQTWQQSDGNSWTYPNGKDRWYGSTKLGNGYEYSLEIVPPTASQPLIDILSTARPVNDTDTRDWRELEVQVRPSSVSDLPDGRRRRTSPTASARRPTGRSTPASTGTASRTASSTTEPRMETSTRRGTSRATRR